ncbi:MAG: glycogen synthase GlgA [Proteobacteria bacterium]|nr:glycogen synthase GlgA [Pseudomonadota bacterium]
MVNKKSPSIDTQPDKSKSPDLAGNKEAAAKAPAAPAGKEIKASTPPAPKSAAEKPSLPSEKPKPADGAEAKAKSTPVAQTNKANGTPATKPAQPPAAASLAAERPIPSESAFVAGLPALPSEVTEDESAKRELLRDVEAQFELFLGANEAIEDADTPPAAESGGNAEAVVEPVRHHPEPAPADEYYQAPEPEHRYDGPTIPHLFIMQIATELSPVAKVGGLADVVYGLSNELEIRGNDVEIILPKYDCLRYDHIWGLCETYNDLWVPWFDGAIHCTVLFGFVHGRKCFFIESHSSENFFNRGSVYGFNDDALRFAFFTRAAMEFIWKSGKNPDIIHCHDWQTALAPVFLYEIYQHLGMHHPRVCFTIHNFKHQGVTGAQILQSTGLNRPEYYYHYDRLRDNHNPRALNLMKAGVVYSNFTTTVSPHHALEAKDQGQGFGLEPTLHIHHHKFGGVVNGVDYSVWNPEIDPLIPVHYTADDVDGKYDNKRALRQRLMLADNQKPIVAFVGRLDPQKGLELIRHAIFYTLHRGGQFVLLGSSPEAQINNYFWNLKQQLNDNPDCHIEIGFNEELAHLIYAGSDMMIVPSRFEPCGLAQLIALRYGTVPVVREVGGLADTVFDKDFSWRPLHERNGYVFGNYDEAGLESALGRAISCYYEFPDHFRETIRNAMRSDNSWKNPGQDYLNIYDFIREK